MYIAGLVCRRCVLTGSLVLKASVYSSFCSAGGVCVQRVCECWSLVLLSDLVLCLRRLCTTGRFMLEAFVSRFVSTGSVCI